MNMNDPGMIIGRAGILRKIFMIFPIMFCCCNISAQTQHPDDSIVGCHNFDNITPGTYIAVELENWTTWGNNPGTAEDGIISDIQSYSQFNSLLIENQSDVIHLLGENNITSGIYIYSNLIFVPEGHCGYFNLQKHLEPGIEWGFQVHFDANGSASCDAGAGSAAVWTFSFDEWHQNELIIDLDNDHAEYWYDGTLMVAWPWSTGTYGNQQSISLGTANYYAWTGSANPKAYFDDICFNIHSTSAIEEQNKEGFYHLYPNPAKNQVTIVSDCVIDEIKLYNIKGSVLYSEQLDTKSHKLNTSWLPPGIYIVHLRSATSSNIHKLIID